MQNQNQQLYVQSINIISPQPANGYKNPIQVICPYCNCSVQSMIDYRVGRQAQCWFFILLICFWPLAWLPCILVECQDVYHYCPRCSKSLGIYSQ